MNNKSRGEEGHTRKTYNSSDYLNTYKGYLCFFCLLRLRRYSPTAKASNIAIFS